MKSTRRLARPVLLVMLLGGLVLSCASGPKHYAAKDLSSIAGKWRGYAATQLGNMFVDFSFGQNGEWQAQTDRPFPLTTFFSGNLWIDEEGKFKLTSQAKGFNGTAALYRDGDVRWIIFQGDDGSLNVELRRY